MNNSFEKTSFEGQYWNLTQSALNKIVETVKAQSGRIALFAVCDAWDEEGSKVADAVIENSIALTIDNGSGNLTMHPIDFFDNNGYTSVLFVDAYGEFPRIYADKMDEMAVLQLADFLVKSFPNVHQQKKITVDSGCYIVVEKHGGAEYAIIVTGEDGNNKVFDTHDEAEQEASDCQDGIVVCID